jgi:hypothetical protein
VTAQKNQFADLYASPGESKKVTLLYASFNFKDYFDILPEMISNAEGNAISVYLYDDIRLQSYYDALPEDSRWRDSILDQKFCKPPAVCRSKELAGNQFVRLQPFIAEHTCSIFAFKSPDKSKDEVLLSLSERIAQDENTSCIVLLPVGFVSAEMDIKSALEQKGFQVQRVLFSPLAAEEKAMLEGLRRKDPKTALDGIPYKQLKKRSKGHLTLLPIHNNRQEFPVSSTYYDYLLLARNPQYLPNPQVQCCK